MAKRYQASREFSRSYKKPKLDISINKGRPIQKSHSADVPRAALSPNKDFWDDDGDDDVLLLATQVAETAVNNKRTECSFALVESQMTFSEFLPHAGSSTQRPLPEQNVPNQDILSQIFEDDFDWGLEAGMKNSNKNNNPKNNNDIFNNVELSDKISSTKDSLKKPLVVAGKSNDVEEFKRPNDVGVNTKAKTYNNNLGNVTQVAAVAAAGGNADTEPEILSQSAARRQLASERQIKFLMDRVDAMKKENQKLSSELEHNKTKITSKEGEISLLRDELKHTKQQMQNMKMERILTADAAKAECKNKIAQLATQVEAKKTEAQLKALECMQLKMRHAEDTQRLEISMRNESMFYDDLPQTQPVAKRKSLPGSKLDREILRIHCSKSLLPRKEESNIVLSSKESFSNKLHSSCLYNETKEDCSLRGISDQVIAQQWQTLRIAAVNLQVAAKKQNLTVNELEEYTKNLFVASSWILHEMNHLAESLSVKNCRVYAYLNYDIRKDFSNDTRQSLLQPSSLYAGESAIELRRCIAVLSLLTRQHYFLAKQLFAPITENCSVEGDILLFAAAKILCRIGFSNELIHHFGLIEAFASLTHSLLIQAVSSLQKEQQIFPEDWQYQIIYLLKEIIFTRPNPWILKEVSYCFLLCLQLPYCLSLLCHHCDAKSFRAEPVRSICEFTNSSCILQVYSSLLEIGFPLYNQISEQHFELLTVITLNHVRFVFKCFTKPPKFIHERLPSYDEDDEDCLEEINGENELPPFTDSEMRNLNEMNTNMYSTSSCTSSLSTTTASTIQQQQLTLPLPLANHKSHNNNNAAALTCECYHRLCISVVTLAYQVLHHWQLLDKKPNMKMISQLAKILVQLLHTIFCDNYLTTLFRDSEDTTKHCLYLICKWISENSQLFKFKAFHLNLLEKLQLSHIMPKPLQDEENMANLTADLADWCRITNDKVSGAVTPTKLNANADIKLLEESTNTEIFFEGLKGYAYNFQ